MIFDLFIIGGVWFWGLCALFGCVLWGTVSNDEGWAAFWSIVVFLLAVHLLGDAKWIFFVRDNPTVCLTWFAIYLIAGLCWSFVRLYYWVREQRVKAAKYGKSGWPQKRPEWSQIKDRVATWILYWPISMLVVVLRDILADLINSIANQFRGRYEAVVAMVWGDLDQQDEEEK